MGRRRVTKRGDFPPLSGYLFCADCGAKLYLSRGKGIPAEAEYYNCKNYKRSPRAECSSHRVMRVSIEQAVLQDLREVLAYAKTHEREFVDYAKSQSEKSQGKIHNSATAELDKAKRRIAEIEAISQSLYEDRVTGKLPPEQCFNMLAKFTDERATLENRVAELSENLTAEQQNQTDTSAFLRLVKSITVPTELTGELLSTFIKRVEVGELTAKGKNRKQDIKIVYNFVEQPPR